MEELKRIWSDTYTVNWYEADITNKASLVTLCNFLQESAWRHANHLGFGYRTASDIKQIWVLVRLLVKMDSYPGWGETITVRTWPRGVDGMLALRDFEVLASDGSRMGGASSQWLILDVESRKPQPAFIVNAALPLATDEPALDEFPEKIVIPGPLPFQSSVKARFTDIDMYQHVNNARYISWVLDMLPEEWHKKNGISSFLIEFINETRLGDEVQLFADITGNPLLVRGVRMEDDKVIFRSRIRVAPVPGSTSGQDYSSS
jgi:medium-chain acyl-[acyl-carrier-protein] hydrolase